MRRVTSFAVRAPGRSIWASPKRFPFTERMQWNFAREFYNIFNHPQLGQPQATFNPAKPAGFGSIINTVNLNTAIVSQ